LPEKGLVVQVRDTMLITRFVCIGIEGASVCSRFAKKRSDVGGTTILGFVAVTGLVIAITLLPSAVAPRAATPHGWGPPSLAGALELAVWHWSAAISPRTLAMLPHNGAMATLLAVCGFTHRDSYFDMIMAAAVSAMVALVSVIMLGTFFSSF
jgi:H+/gluconate symporter-like permease